MKSSNPASAAPVSTRTRRGTAVAAGRASVGQPEDTLTQDNHGLSNLAQRDSIAPGHSQAATKCAAGRKQRPNVSSRQVPASARTTTAQAVSKQVRAPDAMEVDDPVAGTPQYKSKEKRKRTQSESAADAPALPNQEVTSQSMQQPAKKKKNAKANTSEVSQVDQAPMSSTPDATAKISKAPRAQIPPQVKRKGILPKIDVDKPETPQPEGVDKARGQDRSSGRGKGDLDREDGVNEDGEDIDPDAAEGSNMEDDEDQDQPESRDEGDLSNLAHEAVSFTRVIAGTPAPEEVESPASPVPKRATAPVIQPSASRKTTQRERKLAEELPTISAGKPLGQKSSTVAFNTSFEDPDIIDDDHSESEDDISGLWLAHTDISSALKRSSKNKLEVQIKLCSPQVQDVLHASFARGMVLLALGDGTVYPDTKTVEKSLVTPFRLQGMEHISLDALITAAETLGYDGKYDIADRLETGSQSEYIHPLRNYTAHRLRLYRGHIKKAAANAYPSAVQLSKLSRDESNKLLESSNFLYPKLPDGKFQYAQPFMGPGITDTVKAAFFGNTAPLTVGTENLSTLKSSLSSAPHELEVTDTMLAMAAAAIHSVLVDHVHPPVTSKSGATEFAGTALENAFKAYMTILVKMRIKSLTAYHALMHDICMTVTGGNAISIHGNAALNDILANVDWANITGA